MTDFKQDIIEVVDLDKERNIELKPGRTPNQHRVVIRKTSAVNLAALTAYLEGKMQFGTTVLEAISELSAHATVNHY